MIGSHPKKNIVEIFRIQAEDFDLWAVLISLENEKFIVRGATRFKKGDVVSFRSEISDRDSLRDRLLSACGPIAAFFGGRLINREVEGGKGRTRFPCSRRPVSGCTDDKGEAR